MVNWDKYRKLTTKEEKKEADRQRIADQRNAEKSKQNSNVEECSEVSQPVAGCSELSLVSQNVADVAHTDTDTEKRKSMRAAGAAPSSRFAEFWYVYPRNRKHLDRVADSIIGDVRRRVADGAWREKQYTPHASTYLNQERWTDEAAKPQVAGKVEKPDWQIGADAP